MTFARRSMASHEDSIRDCRPPAPFGWGSLTGRTPSLTSYVAQGREIVSSSSRSPRTRPREDRDLRCARSVEREALFKGQCSTDQDAFRRLETRSRDRVRPPCVRSSLRQVGLAPFRPTRSWPFRHAKDPPRRATHSTRGSLLSCSTLGGTMLLPASATNYRHVHPFIVRLSGRPSPWGTAALARCRCETAFRPLAPEWRHD